MRIATLLSAEEFARVAPVLGPCELVKGEIITMSPGGFRHSRITGNAVALLDAFCRPRGIGRVLTGEAGVIVARRPDTVRGADIAFISYERLPKGYSDPGFLERPPELVIEVLGIDVSWAEMETKVNEYHSFGVDLVWVLDPHTLTLRAHRRGAPPDLLRETDTVVAGDIPPGFAAPVAAFFEE